MTVPALIATFYVIVVLLVAAIIVLIAHLHDQVKKRQAMAALLKECSQALMDEADAKMRTVKACLDWDVEAGRFAAVIDLANAGNSDAWAGIVEAAEEYFVATRTLVYSMGARA